MTTLVRTIRIANGIVTSSYSASMIHVAKPVMWIVMMSETAVMMVMMPVMTAPPIIMIGETVPVSPVKRIVSPVPWGTIWHIYRTPQPRIYDWSVDIYWGDDVIVSIDELITDHLNRYFVRRFILLKIDGSNILKYIPR